MPRHSNQQHGGAKSRSESKKVEEKRGAKRVEKSSQVESAKTVGEQPSYESLEETRTGGSLPKVEHRADIARMSRREHGTSSAAAERSPDIDEGPARGEAAGVPGVVSAETIAEQPGRGESRGMGDDSGGALADDQDVPARGSSSQRRASDTDDLTYAGFSRPAPGEGSRTARISGVERSGSAARGESSGRVQEPTARGGFLEPDERTSGSSRRH